MGNGLRSASSIWRHVSSIPSSNSGPAARTTGRALSSVQLCGARFSPPGRCRCKRVVRPGMARIATFHFGFDRPHSCRARSPAGRASPAPAAVPATIARPPAATRPSAMAGWRSRPNSSCTRMASLGPSSGRVVDRHHRARRRGEMGGRLGVEAAAQVPRQQRLARPRQVRRLLRRQARSCRQARRTSQSAVLAASAASERSGHSPPSA